MRRHIGYGMRFILSGRDLALVMAGARERANFLHRPALRSEVHTFCHKWSCALFCVLAVLVTGVPAHAASPALEHRRFQLEQQQDALNLRLQQSLRGRRDDLSAADQRRLQSLQLQQQLEYQQLELHQLQREQASRRSPLLPNESAERRLDLQRELFAQQRQLELQRFELEQQRLLQSMQRQPLQPPLDAGRLRLP